jgi:hypothetical protein
VSVVEQARLMGTGKPGPDEARWRLSAFGLEIDSDFELPGAHAAGASQADPDLALRRVPQADLWDLIGDERILRWLNVFDGRPYAMLEGPGGDVLTCYGYETLFHLSADRDALRCAPAARADAHWQRLLLDTVLWTVSLLRGFELLHASAVETPVGTLAFAAMSGGGKSSLAAEHLRRGGVLFCDDVVALKEAQDEVIAFPGPPVMNLPRGLTPDELGDSRVIAWFEDEQWVRVGAPRPSPQPLAAIVLVDRAAGQEARCSRIEATNLTLLPHAFGFPHLTERARTRFDLLARLATTTPVLHLTADPSLPPTALADMVEGAVASL